MDYPNAVHHEYVFCLLEICTNGIHKIVRNTISIAFQINDLKEPPVAKKA
ncbi:MAG: hypothetical protein ACLROI_11395 [Beduini sp.]